MEDGRWKMGVGSEKLGANGSGIFNNPYSRFPRCTAASYKCKAFTEHLLK
jgi:hypothetical protein